MFCKQFIYNSDHINLSQHIIDVADRTDALAANASIETKARVAGAVRFLHGRGPFASAGAGQPPKVAIEVQPCLWGLGPGGFNVSTTQLAKFAAAFARGGVLMHGKEV